MASMKLIALCLAALFGATAAIRIDLPSMIESTATVRSTL